jgi:hypothetical protein
MTIRALTEKELEQVCGGQGQTTQNPGGQSQGRSQETTTPGTAPPGQNKNLPRGLQD